MHDKIFDMLVNREEITWQTIIFDSIKQENMDPWDVNLTLLAQRFIDMVKKLKETDFRISGRIILAAAILLRLKSTKLIDEDINELDRLIAMEKQTEESFYEELESEIAAGAMINPENKNRYDLIPRTPQPRKRKISVYDLVDALNKALEVKTRREGRVPEDAPEVRAPEKVVDISIIINDIYNQIKNYYIDKKEAKLTFSQLLPSDSAEDKVYTFLPLLHLTNQRKIDLEQQEHFGEISIFLLNNKKASVIGH